MQFTHQKTISNCFERVLGNWSKPYLRHQVRFLLKVWRWLKILFVVFSSYTSSMSYFTMLIQKITSQLGLLIILRFTGGWLPLPTLKRKVKPPIAPHNCFHKQSFVIRNEVYGVFLTIIIYIYIYRKMRMTVTFKKTRPILHNKRYIKK